MVSWKSYRERKYARKVKTSGRGGARVKLPQFPGSLAQTLLGDIRKAVASPGFGKGTETHSLVANRVALLKRAYPGVTVMEIARSAGVKKDALYGRIKSATARPSASTVAHDNAVKSFTALLEGGRKPPVKGGAQRGALVTAVARLFTEKKLDKQQALKLVPAQVVMAAEARAMMSQPLEDLKKEKSSPRERIERLEKVEGLKSEIASMTARMEMLKERGMPAAGQLQEIRKKKFELKRLQGQE